MLYNYLVKCLNQKQLSNKLKSVFYIFIFSLLITVCPCKIHAETVFLKDGSTINASLLRVEGDVYIFNTIMQLAQLTSWFSA